MLDTLIFDSMVERTKYAKYRLGAGCFYLARSGRYNKSEIEICRPVLLWLRDKTGETPLIAQIKGGTRYVIDYATGNFKLMNSGDTILAGDSYNSATGRLICAHLSPYELYDFIDKNGLPTKEQWQEFNSKEDFIKELSLIKEAKYVCYKTSKTAIGYAAPLFVGKEFFGALGLAVNANNPSSVKNHDTFVKALLCAAKEINRRLNF